MSSSSSVHYLVFPEFSILGYVGFCLLLSQPPVHMQMSHVCLCFPYKFPIQCKLLGCFCLCVVDPGKLLIYCLLSTSSFEYLLTLSLFLLARFFLSQYCHQRGLQSNCVSRIIPPSAILKQTRHSLVFLTGPLSLFLLSSLHLFTLV